MLKGLKMRLRALLRKNEMERHLDEEMSLHLERIVERNIAQGMSHKGARNAALRDFGGFEQAKEECRDARGVRALEQFGQDLRYGVRMLRKRPAFTLVAIRGGRCEWTHWSHSGMSNCLSSDHGTKSFL